MKYLINLFIILTITSCSYRFGSISTSSSQDELKSVTVGIAMGSSSTKKVLGIGGLSQRSLVYKAKQDLYKNFILDEGQYFANFSVEYKYSFFPFWQKTTAQIHAEIKEIDKKNSKKDNFRVLKYKHFNLSDSIYIPKNASYSKAKIIEFDFEKMLCMNEKGNIKKVKYSKAYSSNGSLHLNDKTYTVGHKYSISARDIRTNEISGYENVLIVGLRDKNMLIKDGNRFYEVIFEHYYIENLQNK